VAPKSEVQSTTAPDPVAATLDAANAAHSTTFQLLGRLPGGYQNGAYELRTEGGQRAVLKRWFGPRPVDQLRQAAATVETAKSVGWPTPAWLYWGMGPDGVAYGIYEFVDGHHRHALDEPTLDALLTINALQRDLDPPTTNNWSSWVVEVVYEGRESILDEVSDFPAGGSRFGSAIARVRTWAGSLAPPDRDLVCGVFDLENVLFDADGVAGVIDVQAIGRGTRAFDLAVLYSRLTAGERQSPIGRRLRGTAESVAGPAVFAVCMAAEFLGLLLFVVRNNPTVGPAIFENAAEALESLVPRMR